MPTPPPTFLDRYKGYQFFLPNGGGKAGTRKNLTTNIQVRRSNCLEKQFRFTVGDQASYFDALQKARDWVDAHPVPPRG